MCRLRTGLARTNWYRCVPERKYFGASRNDEGVLMSDAESTGAAVKPALVVETTTIVVADVASGRNRANSQR